MKKIQLSSSGKVNNLLFIIVLSTFLSMYLTFVYAVPVGPTITQHGNTTKGTPSGVIVNDSINDTSPGGYIFTINLNSEQQNPRWKAYVGNVTGTLTLDDANDFTLFQWSLSTVTGEVYATRASGQVNWTGVNCTWRGEGVTRYNESNRTVEEIENRLLNHSNGQDNITATFSLANHTQLEVGALTIPKDSCFAVSTWQNNAVQAFTDSDNANFTQVLLYDGTNTTNGNVIYASQIYEDANGFRNGITYDFQMILPENGLSTWTSSTAYYFYVELT